MALYMEYPKRKVPHGVPAAQHVPEVPSLSTTVKNFVPSPVSCTSPSQTTTVDQEMRMSSPPPPPPMEEEPQQHDDEIAAAPQENDDVVIIQQQQQQEHVAGVVSPPQQQHHGILYPSRTLSPRPSNTNKRVTWPDMETKNDDDTQYRETQKSRLHGALDDFLESFSAGFGVCCGGTPTTPTEQPQPLETVYELQQHQNQQQGDGIHKNDTHLTIDTDLPMVIETPPADDPILSFREKKLTRKTKKRQDVQQASNNDSDIMLATDTLSSEEDETSPPSDHPQEQRDDTMVASNDDDEDEDDWAPITRISALPPTEPPALQQWLHQQVDLRQEELLKQKQEATPRTQQVVQETLLQGIPPQLATMRKQSSSHFSVSTWFSDDHDKKQNWQPFGGTPRNIKSPRLRMLGLRRPKHHHKQPPSPQHFAEIEWKHPTSPTNESHVAEIPWKTHEGKKVALLKKNEFESRVKQNVYIPTVVDRDWEHEIKQVLSSPVMSMSSNSEEEGDRYKRTRTTQKQRQGGFVEL